ncbi:MAG: hypothetical protein JNL08_02335 [Planctomycetes bacterium]|nr:hypothetical protein [Planctomycetota bacterium]
MSIVRCAFALVVTTWTGSIASQSPDPVPPQRSIAAPPLDCSRSVGLAATDEGLVGASLRYVARFGPEVVFTPVLGSAASRDLPLAYRLQAVGRGELAPITPTEPVADGTTVRYEHGPVTATYEVRHDGLKQGFVFASLPPGDGDLVVRGTIATELPLVHADARSLQFELPGIGGVHVGAVLGIDAAGRQVVGELRVDGDRVDYVLPAEFVARAELPLVVDPLLTTASYVGIGADGGPNGGWDRDPDLAYDPTADVYLVVFRTNPSVSNKDLFGQRFTAAGLVGGLIAIETAASTLPSDPCVADVRASGGFVVAWHQSGDILARGVAAATGSTTGVVGVATGADAQVQPDLAGEMDATHTAAVCVWANSTTSDIQARHLIYTPGSLLIGLTVTTFANPVSSPYSAPCIAQHDGESGRRLICWERFVSLGTANQALVAVVVDRNLATVAGPTLLFNNSLDEHDPDCDGDGDSWVVAFEREEMAGSASANVLAVPLHLSAGSLVAGTEVGISTFNVIDEVDPSVCWLRESCLVAFGRQPNVLAVDYDTHVRSIDPLGCRACEGTFQLDLGLNTKDDSTTIAWRRGNGTDDEAMIVWASYLQFVPVPGLPSLVAIPFRGDDGRVTEVEAGCGTGGRLATKCARSGHAEFALSLAAAAPSTITALVLATARIDYPCGSCVLVPDPFLGFLGGVAITSAVGDASTPLPLPAGIGGAAFYAQYVTVGGTCFGGFSLSNAVLVNID